ncbi:MAG TPA: hypothetical protein VHV83_10380 [Armatimonadota bacterium]|nr:hypothetical protein [Armatimonadota bacterium]
MKRFLAMFSAILLLMLQGYADDMTPKELITNGNFEMGATTPKDWALWSGATWVTENGNHFVRFNIAKPGETAYATRALDLQPEWGVIRLTTKIRYHDIVRGPEGWQTGRIAMDFLDAQGKRTGAWPDVLNWTGSCPTWTQESRDFIIPEGAKSLVLTLAIFNCQSGQLDFDDISLTVVKSRDQISEAPTPPNLPTKLWQTQTATRGRICLNGYWQFRPLGLPGTDMQTLTPAMLTTPPALPKTATWGWMPVPGSWPGQWAEGHHPLTPDVWQAVNWQAVTAGWYENAWQNINAAWYQRDVTVPADWQDRRITISFDMPQTQVNLFVIGESAGVVRWPYGQLDITRLAHPGSTLHLTAFVTALPFTAEKMVAMRDDFVFKAAANIRFRGLCGDVYLESVPESNRIETVQFRPSVQYRQLGLAIQLAKPAAKTAYTISMDALWQGTAEKHWQSAPIIVPADGHVVVAVPWVAKHLWDLDQPNLYQVCLRLREAKTGAVLDERMETLGFREVWQSGRNVVLNGMPIHWRCLDFSNITAEMGSASYTACRATFRRMRALGFNFAILSNYSVSPGETATFEDLLRAADDEGFLLSFTAPHPLSSWNSDTPQHGVTEEWRTLADYCIQRVCNHPSVLAYAMTHNMLGYIGDEDPACMDGITPPMPSTPAQAKDFLAKREIATAAEQYLKHLDPTRLVYHHESGNMNDWITVNCYLNWSPIQERMDWLSHWATAGVKPLFFVEYGLPHWASWGSHRLGAFIWSSKVNTEPWTVEYGALATGDAAYKLTTEEEQHIDNYERVYKTGQPFMINDVLGDYWANAREHNMVEIQAEHAKYIWPAFRTWGITGLLPWDQGDVSQWKENSPQNFSCHWTADEMASPGIHPEYLRNNGDYFKVGDDGRVLTSLGETFKRVNADFYAYIAGRPGRFTEQGHLFRPGDRIVKQIIIINDQRTRTVGKYRWSVILNGKTIASAEAPFSVAPATNQRIPITITVPNTVTGNGEIALTVTPTAGTAIQDSFALTVVPATPTPAQSTAIYDPKGLTLKTLQRLGVHTTVLPNTGIPANTTALIIGRQALTVSGNAPDISPVLARGGTVLVMEQDEDVLSRRLGFRTNVPSLRQVNIRVADHPALANMTDDMLHDWQGESTLIPSQYTLPTWEDNYPTTNWLDFPNSRVWKWGNQGQVASTVIEKPQDGDFLPILDGGFDLQYSPLLEARVGNGRIIFCQMDLSGRSIADPAADKLLVNLVEYLQTAKAPSPVKPVQCLAGDATKRLLEQMGVEKTTDATSGIVVADNQTTDTDALRTAAEQGAHVIVLDGTNATLQALFPAGTRFTNQQITHTPPPIANDPAWKGISPAELHFRSRTDVIGVQPPAGQGNAVSTGVLATVPVGKGAIIHCAVTPLEFDYTKPNMPYVKLTNKRTTTLVARLLANQGVAFHTPLLDYWMHPTTRVQLSTTWQGIADPNQQLTADKVSAPDFDTKGWSPIHVPGAFEGQNAAWSDYDGIFWYRIVIDLPSKLATTETSLLIGQVDDEDWTYINRKFVGHTGTDTNPNNYWCAQRQYQLPIGTLQPGKNVIVVKVRDLHGNGGIIMGPAAIQTDSRWLSSYYLDTPQGNDDPYRYNRW